MSTNGDHLEVDQHATAPSAPADVEMEEASAPPMTRAGTVDLGKEAPEVPRAESSVLEGVTPQQAVTNVRKQQKKALDDLRAQQNANVEAEQEVSKKDRLSYLLQQTEIFRHFMHGAGGSPANPANTAKP